MSGPLNIPSGIVTVSGFVSVNALPVALWGASGVQTVGYTVGLDSKTAINVFTVSGSAGGGGGGSSNISGGVTVSGLVGISGGAAGLSGLVVLVSGAFVYTSGGGSPNISGGVTVSGGVQVSGFVGVTSGGVIPISIVSGSLSGMAVTTSVSGNVVNAVSGSNLPVYLISGNLTSGVVDIGSWPAYGLTSYWSGTAGKGLIGVYNSGATSGVVMQITQIDIGIFASGNINRIDFILGSGQISGTVATGSSGISKFFTNDPASNGVAYVDGGTQVSGNVIFVTDSLILEANSSGYLHDYTYNLNEIRQRPITVQSGQEFWVRQVSGIGVGTISLNWIERLLS